MQVIRIPISLCRKIPKYLVRRLEPSTGTSEASHRILRTISANPFSGEFLCHDDPDFIGPSERPISLHQAIVSIEKETWRGLAHHVFGVAPDLLTADTVFRSAIETDTCDNPVSPVEVWIDPDGFYTVLVHGATTDGR